MNARLRSLALVLALALPPLLAQWALPVPRLDADSVEYFAHLRSLYYDHDVSFENEFAYFGILTRWDKTQPTPTGLRRTNFSVGPALLWLPFYAVADLAARAGPGPEDGYSALHVRAVALGSLVYAVLGLLLVRRLVAEREGAAVGSWTALLLLYGTFLYWYVVNEPVMSHAGSFFLAALALAIWWRHRDGLGPWRALALGLALGLASCVRWQNALLLTVPAFTLAAQLRRERRLPGALATLGLGFLLGVLPQLLVFEAIFGAYLLPYPVQGRDYLKLWRPALLETLFSSRHGLLYWTPLLWAGFLGLLGRLRREPRGFAPLVATLACMTYVNACSEDWWAGGSFSNRRFDSVLPVLALGLGTSLTWLRELARRRPGAVLAAAGGALAAWNLLFMEQYRRNAIPRDDTVAFGRVSHNNADLLAELVGTPVAWPANWAFAARHGLPPDRYDLMVGKYLFLRQNNLGGVIDLGDDRADPALLGEGWSGRVACEAAVCRELDSVARVFAPLELPEPLQLTVRAQGSGTLRLAVNGAPAAEFPLDATLRELSVRLPASAWRRELNELRLSVTPGGRARVDKLVFVQVRT
jgi:hypothetical protein